MFEIKIQNPQSIVIRENGKDHNVSMDLKYWRINDLLNHWLFETHQLLDGYCTQLLFLGMVEPKSNNYLRALRAIRTTNHIHFDDVYIQSPWTVHSWNPIDIIYHLMNIKLFMLTNISSKIGFLNSPSKQKNLKNGILANLKNHYQMITNLNLNCHLAQLVIEMGVQ